MKFLFNCFIIICVILGTQQLGFSKGAVRVRGYVTKKGTYVPPHWRSSPDKNFWNNYSTKGNINPFTGKEGKLMWPPNTFESAIRFRWDNDQIIHSQLNWFPPKSFVEEPESAFGSILVEDMIYPIFIKIGNVTKRKYFWCEVNDGMWYANIDDIEYAIQGPYSLSTKEIMDKMLQNDIKKSTIKISDRWGIGSTFSDIERLEGIPDEKHSSTSYIDDIKAECIHWWYDFNIYGVGHIWFYNGRVVKFDNNPQKFKCFGPTQLPSVISSQRSKWTIGDTMEIVREVEGPPNSMGHHEYYGTITWYYLGGWIKFKNNVVIDYNNDFGRLKIK